MSSISRRRNGLMVLSVIGGPVLGEVLGPSISTARPCHWRPYRRRTGIHPLRTFRFAFRRPDLFGENIRSAVSRLRRHLRDRHATLLLAHGLPMNASARCAPWLFSIEAA